MRNRRCLWMWEWLLRAVLGAESQLEGNSFGQQLQGTSLASSFQLCAAFHTSCGAGKLFISNLWSSAGEQLFGATNLKNRSFAPQTMSGWKFCAHGNFESSFPGPLLRISLAAFQQVLFRANVGSTFCGFAAALMDSCLEERRSGVRKQLWEAALGNKFSLWGEAFCSHFPKKLWGPFCCICLNGCSFGAVALDGGFWLQLWGAAFSSRYAKCLWGAILGSESQLWSKQTFLRRARRDLLKNEYHHFDCNFEEQLLCRGSKLQGHQVLGAALASIFGASITKSLREQFSVETFSVSLESLEGTVESVAALQQDSPPVGSRFRKQLPRSSFCIHGNLENGAAFENTFGETGLKHGRLRQALCRGGLGNSLRVLGHVWGATLRLCSSINGQFCFEERWSSSKKQFWHAAFGNISRFWEPLSKNRIFRPSVNLGSSFGSHFDNFLLKVLAPKLRFCTQNWSSKPCCKAAPKSCAPQLLPKAAISQQVQPFKQIN